MRGWGDRRVCDRLRNLGCVIENVAASTVAKRVGAGNVAAADADGEGGTGKARAVKVARLRVPLSFPKPKRGPSK